MMVDMLKPLPDKERPMRRIIRWEYRSNNSSWGYDAILECGHKRTDLTSERHARNARCWNCEIKTSGQP